MVSSKIRLSADSSRNSNFRKRALRTSLPLIDFFGKLIAIVCRLILWKRWIWRSIGWSSISFVRAKQSVQDSSLVGILPINNHLGCCTNLVSYGVIWHNNLLLPRNHHHGRTVWIHTTTRLLVYSLCKIETYVATLGMLFQTLWNIFANDDVAKFAQGLDTWAESSASSFCPPSLQTAYDDGDFWQTPKLWQDGFVECLLRIATWRWGNGISIDAALWYE